MVDELTLIPNSKDKIIIYPNPSKDLINIEINNKKKKDWCFYIVDVNGLIIMKEKRNTIDVSSLSNGNYVIYGAKGNRYVEGVHLIKK